MRDRGGTVRRTAMSAGAVLAAISTFLLLLHIAATLGLSMARQDAGGGLAPPKGSLFAAVCAIGEHGGEDSPARDDGYSQCCVLCDARISAVAFIHLVETAIGAPIPSEAGAAESRIADKIHEKAPLGWASSWSSHSPPSSPD